MRIVSDKKNHVTLKKNERGYSQSSSANSFQVPYFLIRRAAKKVTFIANMRTDLRVCECECVCILPIYTSHPVTVFHDIYHEINVKNHSSANSLQVPYFLIFFFFFLYCEHSNLSIIHRVIFRVVLL